MNFTEKIDLINEFARKQLDEVILPFWLNNIEDEVNGGFLGRIDMDNNRFHRSPKGIILNSRLLWTFSALYGHRKNPEYLRLAKKAKDYIENYFYDQDWKGYYWTLKPDARPENDKKQIYAQAFVIYALSEFGLQTGEEGMAGEAGKIWQLVEEKSFDPHSNGYFEAFSRNWGEIEDLRLSSLDMNEKKTMNTHLHIIEAYTRLFHLRKDDYLAERIKNLLGVFYNRILDKYKEHLNLFFDENWQVKSTFGSYGHDIEAAWLLRESALAISDKEEIKRFSDVCLKLADSAMEAIRPEGGLIHDFDRVKKVEEEYEWWAQAEGIAGFLEAWKISGDEKYLDAALGLKNFVEKYFVDHNYGEWYYRLNKNGNPLPGYEKAGLWKCPYHSVRMCLEVIRFAG